MEIEQVEKTRKRRFAYLCTAFLIPLIIGFTIVDIYENDTVEVLLDILTGVILFACILSLRRLNVDMMIYRLGLASLCLAFFYNVIIGSGNGTAIYWLFPFPIMFLFFLGRKEGTVFSAVFITLLCIILLNPLSFKSYSYNTTISIRFLVSLLFVTLIAYGLESSREKYGSLFSEKQASLVKEKQQLEIATNEIKHLSGLLPICSQCKKIRDDAGYWQQVEVYVRDRSDASFSHSICPDCAKLLYPEIQHTLKW